MVLKWNLNDVLLLLWSNGEINKQLLELFVAIIDHELLKTVSLKREQYTTVMHMYCYLKYFKTINIKYTNWFPLTTSLWLDKEWEREREREYMIHNYLKHLYLVIDSAHNPREESLIDSFSESITCKFTLSINKIKRDHSWPLTSVSESGVSTNSFEVSTLFFVRHCSSSWSEQPSISQAKVAAKKIDLKKYQSIRVELNN